jgi:hypothetical protein
MAATVEKMYRFETNHFKSKQYKETGTPGMEVHGAAPPMVGEVRNFSTIILNTNLRERLACTRIRDLVEVEEMLRLKVNKKSLL